MARSARDTKLDTRAARLKLKVGQRHWKSIGKGLALGYRRTTEGYGTWTVRMLNDEGRYALKALATADDFQDSDGDRVLDFYEAQERARIVAMAESNSRRQHNHPHETLTVNDAATMYLEWYKEHRKAFKETQATINAHILPAFGEKLVKDVTSLEIRAWHHKLATQPARRRTRVGSRQQYQTKAESADAKRARKSTANRILTVLKAILNRAFQDELVPDDTAWRKVKPFANADEPITRFLTEAESSRLINASRPDFRVLVKGALFTGARYSELASLLVSHVNTDSGTVYFKPAKSGRGRHVPLSEEGLDFFKALVVGKRGKVFLKEDGEPWGKNHHTRLLQEACIKAHIEPRIGFHELRHTYASLLAQAGVDLLTISKLLGHADTRVTSRHYAHLSDKTLANAVRDHLPGFGHRKQTKVRAIR